MLIIQSIVSGILVGGLFAMMAVGVSLAWGMLRVINLAHFSLILLAGYLTFQLSTVYAIDPFLTILVTTPIWFVIGMALQWFFESFAIEDFESMLVTFGLFIMFESVMRTIWSADYQRIPLAQNPYAVQSIWLGPVGKGIALPVPQLGAFLASLLVAGFTMYLLNYTYFGKAIRAVAQDKTMAAAFGVNYRRLGVLLFGLATAYAAIAGGFIAIGQAIFPSIALEWFGLIFAVVILGGLGNTPGAVGAGIIIGVASALASVWGGPSWAPLVTFVILVLTLLFKPEGLFARKASL